MRQGDFYQIFLRGQQGNRGISVGPLPQRRNILPRVGVVIGIDAEIFRGEIRPQAENRLSKRRGIPDAAESPHGLAPQTVERLSPPLSIT